jgi:extradiol dioxygenase family protein
LKLKTQSNFCEATIFYQLRFIGFHFLGHAVPIPHFGVVLEWDQIWELAENIKKAGVSFEIEPYVRFKDQPGEQATMVR